MTNIRDYPQNPLFDCFSLYTVHLRGSLRKRGSLKKRAYTLPFYGPSFEQQIRERTQSAPRQSFLFTKSFNWLDSGILHTYQLSASPSELGNWTAWYFSTNINSKTLDSVGLHN